MLGRRTVPTGSSAAPVALSLRIDGTDSAAVQHVAEVRVSHELGGLPASGNDFRCSSVCAAKAMVSNTLRADLSSPGSGLHLVCVDRSARARLWE